MADCDRNKLYTIIAGAAVAFVAFTIYSQMNQTSEPKEEKKVEEEEKFTSMNSFTMKKVNRLKEAHKKFEEGLASHGDIAISRVPHLAETHDCDIFDSPLHGDISKRDAIGESGETGFLPSQAFSSVNKFILAGKSYT